VHGGAPIALPDWFGFRICFAEEEEAYRIVSLVQRTQTPVESAAAAAAADVDVGSWRSRRTHPCVFAS